MKTKRADSYETPMIHDTSSFNENDLIEFDNQYEHFEEVNQLGGFWKVQEMANQKYTVAIYYRTTTPESAEAGDYADQGEKDRTEDMTLDEVAGYIRHGYFRMESAQDQCLQTTDPDRDYRTGARTYHDMYIEDASGKAFEGADLAFFVKAAEIDQDELSDIVEAFTGVGQDAPRAVERHEFADPNQQKLQFDKGGRVMKGVTDDVVGRIAGALKAKKAVKKIAAEETGYQGWKNYETWAVALWLDNDEGSSDYWREQAAQLQGDMAEKQYDERDSGDPNVHGKPSDRAQWDLAEQLKQHHEDMAEELGAQGVFADLLNAALSEVDWDEIAEHFISKG
jgi:hypothetical protein